MIWKTLCGSPHIVGKIRWIFTINPAWGEKKNVSQGMAEKNGHRFEVYLFRSISHTLTGGHCQNLSVKLYFSFL